MRSFTNEEKLKAIELYIKYDFSPGAVIYELGYPAARCVLYRWYKTCVTNGNKFPVKKHVVIPSILNSSKKMLNITFSGSHPSGTSGAS